MIKFQWLWVKSRASDNLSNDVTNPRTSQVCLQPCENVSWNAKILMDGQKSSNYQHHISTGNNIISGDAGKLVGAEVKSSKGKVGGN